MYTRRLKWIIPILVALVLLAVPAVVFGGGRWSGMDPELTQDGHRVNIWVEWHSEHSCDIRGDIRFMIRAPGAELGAESTDSFLCADGGSNEITTSTRLIRGGREGEMSITTHLRSSERFPARIKVYLDGQLERVCEGTSQRPFRCSIEVQ